MTASANPTHGVSHRDTFVAVWQLSGHAAQALEQAANLLDEIGQGLPPAEQAIAHDAACTAVRHAWDAVAAIRDRMS